MTATPVLEPRNAQELVADLRRRLPAYVPGWQPPAGGSGHALLEIYARYLRALADRIGDAPDKNKLAFLDLLGVTLLTAQAARAPVAFATIPGLGDGTAPAGTRVGAKVPATEPPLVFETERAIGLAEARLAEVVTVWPGRDAYADHSADAIGGRPFTLWEPLTPIRHELYLAHDGHFALAGTASVELEFELERVAGDALDVAWQYWDGDSWRDFKAFRVPDTGGASFDGTRGLTRNGTVRLTADCAESAKTVVGGWNAHWVRGVLDRRLPPSPDLHVPLVDRVQLRTVVERTMTWDGTSCTGGLVPEQSFAGAEQLDLTKLAFPLGRTTGVGIGFYVACEEAFSRPGAAVTVCVERATTPEDEADDDVAPYEAAVNAAATALDDASNDITKLIQTLDDLIAAELPQTFDPLVDDQLVDAIRKHTNDALAAIRDAAGPASWQQGGLGLIHWTLTPLGIPPTTVGATYIGTAIATYTGAQVIYDLAVALRNLSSGAPQNLVNEVDALKTALDGVVNDMGIIGNPSAAWVDKIAAAGRVAIAIPGIIAAWVPVAVNLTQWPATSFVEANLPGLINLAKQRYETLKTHIKNTRNKLTNEVKPKLQELKAALDDIGPAAVAASAGAEPPELQTPRLVWEYWNGSGWRQLVAPSSDAVKNLLGSGTFTFTAPNDWASSEVSDVSARWLRARLASGSYGRVRVMSWKDVVTKELKFMPIIEARPPALDGFRIGYRWQSKASAPERCLTLNDFQWADRTPEAAWRGDPFAPFTPTDDATPSLYLGFDRPLPADLIGILLDLEEVPGEEEGPPLEWQYHDGAAWRPLPVEDETASLALPGIAYALWPGTSSPPAATLTGGEGREVRLADARDAARFTTGQLVDVRSGDAGELATVADVGGAAITTEAPLTRSYTGGTLQLASLPRFGVPRTWLRARLRDDGDPRRTRVRGVHPNAVWAAQVETVENELLGSGNGEPRQTLFFTRTPVLPGQEVEVRELDGRRAEIELPLLVDALAPLGIRESDLTIERDPRSGEATAVWVPWRERPNLFFSGPGDRHYTIERARGRIQFGDGERGRIPPAGVDNVRARRYRAGGGTRGNLPAGALTQVLSGLVVAGVTNPRAASGGADTEPLERVRTRGPLTVRSRRQAVSLADFEALAREASPAVAVARATRAPSAGAVTVAIIPFGEDPQPQPTFGLRRTVRSFLVRRSAAAMTDPPLVVGPAYEPVGVRAAIAPADPSAGGVVAAEARRALERFLHPLTGGPEGSGWPFGRDVFASDVAALLERLDGVDYVETLQLLVGGSPRGERAPVPAERLVAAGPIRVTLVGRDA